MFMGNSLVLGMATDKLYPLTGKDKIIIKKNQFDGSKKKFMKPEKASHITTICNYCHTESSTIIYDQFET